MRHFSRRDVVLSAGSQLALLVPGSARSQDASADTGEHDIIDDPSRMDLFEAEVVIAGLADEETANNAGKTLALPPVFYLPDDAAFDRIENHPRDKSIFGIDISHYTTLSPGVFRQLKYQRVRFVYVKASQGVGGRDAKFVDFWHALGDLKADVKVARGAYHFISSNSPGKQQAEYFFSRLTQAGGLGTGAMPPVLDLEWDRVPGNSDQWRGKGKNFIVDTVNDCAKHVKELTGREPICYSAKSWFSNDTIPLKAVSELSEIKQWWWADYNTKRKLTETPAVAPDTNTVLWQFTDRAQLRTGYQQGLDTSVFYGDEDSFRSTFGLA